ncbi:TetR-like C-terminal domain-containing protein [Staphylococcus xylosus]|uniref:TetR-like C-terminal domain-containing protein n=1 Tax=Staphylococcus xylosus TaxID=1288 RepID=UPI0022776E9C|nr:TetR-like C-terminal domain-containing protein [Staphylococcus xylosus]MCE7782779.1 TetR family transcriptional regulator C-terminal domain-containing protein [Staphylococcus xylosus]
MVEDRRVRKTKNAIKQAFIKLLAEKELERITIQDITTLMYANMVKIISNKQKISGIPIDYFHSYFSGATISFIKHWVQDNNRMEPNIVADHLFKIIFNGPLRLMAKEQYK